MAAISGATAGIQLGIISPSVHGGRPAIVVAALCCICWILVTISSGLVKDSKIVFILSYLVAMNGLILGAAAIWVSRICPYEANVAWPMMALASFATGVAVMQTLKRAELAHPKPKKG